MTLLAETILMTMLESDGHGHSVGDSLWTEGEIRKAIDQIRRTEDSFREMAASLGRIEKILNA